MREHCEDQKETVKRDDEGSPLGRGRRTTTTHKILLTAMQYWAGCECFSQYPLKEILAASSKSILPF